jgi:primosomal replication protein N
MNRPDTSVSFRALVEATLAFAAGQVLGLAFVSTRIHEPGIGVGGAFLLISPFFALCLIPACVARLYHEAWRHALNRGSYIAVWFVAAFLFSCGWGLFFINARAPVLAEALGLGRLVPVIGFAYGLLGPFVLPLVLAATVPRRFRLRASPSGAF